MTIQVKGYVVGKGGYSDIVALGDGRVLKAFRRKNHTHDNEVGDWTDHDAVTRAIFRAEAQAYERLQAVPDLEKYAPRFYGRSDPIATLVLNVDNAPYIAGCGLILEFIPGHAVKLCRLAADVEKSVSAVVERMRDNLQIQNVWDASCFVPGSRAEFTVIDFAYWDGSAYEMALADGATLSGEMREKLERENSD